MWTVTGIKCKAVSDKNYMALTGSVYELQSDMQIVWSIKSFSSLSHETNVYYNSPKFYFSGSSWQLMIYLNGQTRDKSEGFISLYLRRKSTGSAVTVNFSLSLMINDQKLTRDLTNTVPFFEKDNGWGYSKVILRSQLMEKLTNLTDWKFLVVMCNLTNDESSSVSDSLFTRQQEICDNLKEIYDKGKRADCTIKVDGCDIPAHRMILETRSPVFAAMFTHDMKENQTGEIRIDDIGKSTMETILMHMYTGDMNNPTKENVLCLYEAAEKYHVKYVKEICLDFVENNLCADWVCDVIKFTMLFKDGDMEHIAKEYFYENVREILDTEKWETFKKEHRDISIELLSTVAKRFAPK